MGCQSCVLKDELADLERRILDLENLNRRSAPASFMSGLTRRQYALYYHMCRRPNRIWKLKDMARFYWQGDAPENHRQPLYQFVHNVRNAFGDMAIICVHRIGYRVSHEAAQEFMRRHNQ